ncbi:recombinase family protein [Winogradskyella vidalii]|uniref:recombinase family protein n=1 Tax=Winogradskyella vidalii TaxID=2615024 RepID=UPI0015C69B27|nr:recombinase family protein [Winogradskyella vidalii]
MKARYIRVSTSNQSEKRQLINESNNERVYYDICSGSIPFAEREDARELLTAVNNGGINYVSVHSIDRLGRNLLDILNTLELFTAKGVTVKVDNLGIESLIDGKENSAFKLIISVLANISEMERSTLLERQAEGIAIAKANGTYKGRAKGSKESNKTVLTKHKEVVKYLKQNHSLRNVAKLSNVSLGTVQKVKGILQDVS